MQARLLALNCLQSTLLVDAAATLAPGAAAALFAPLSGAAAALGGGTAVGRAVVGASEGARVGLLVVAMACLAAAAAAAAATAAAWALAAAVCCVLLTDAAAPWLRCWSCEAVVALVLGSFCAAAPGAWRAATSTRSRRSGAGRMRMAASRACDLPVSVVSVIELG